MTYGFENHTGDKALVAARDGSGKERLLIQAQDSVDKRYLVIIVNDRTNVPPYPSLTGWLDRKEAIYLRNRLTAFIEKGIDDEDE